MPHKHHHVLATYHLAGEEHATIKSALEAKRDWENTPWEHRVSVFRKASEILAGPWRPMLNAATMLGQSKTVHQAEIDSACELVDFFRFNCHYASEIYGEQPASTRDARNSLDYRPLEGLCSPSLPLTSRLLRQPGFSPRPDGQYGGGSRHRQRLLCVLSDAAVQDRGLPDGVINFVPGPGKVVGDVVMASRDLPAFTSQAQLILSGHSVHGGQ